MKIYRVWPLDPFAENMKIQISLAKLWSCSQTVARQVPASPQVPMLQLIGMQNRGSLGSAIAEYRFFLNDAHRRLC